MSRLQALFDETGQSPWLDCPIRYGLHPGWIDQWEQRGVRGVSVASVVPDLELTAGAAIGDEDVRSCLRTDLGTEDLYWDYAIDRVVNEALVALRPLYDRSEGRDGFVVIGLPPNLAYDIPGLVGSARALHRQLAQPNLMIAVPATDAGVYATRALTSEGISVNPTLIFSLRRYEQVIEAFLSGLETCPGDLSRVHSVASFTLGELDRKVDDSLHRRGSPVVPVLQGKTADALARAAYRMFRDRFKGHRWETLAHRGATVQRPLWVSASSGGSTSLSYANALIGSDSVSAMSEEALQAFEEHGRVATTLRDEYEDASALLDELRILGVDLDLLSDDLERTAIQARVRTYDALLRLMTEKLKSSSD